MLSNKEIKPDLKLMAELARRCVEFTDRGCKIPFNECPGYDIKPSDGNPKW